jgi:hypothetical protein
LHRILFLDAVLTSFAHAATAFGLSTDFSFRDNPNKVWQYGYSATNSLDLTEFRFDKYADPTGPVGFWHPSASSEPGPRSYPYVAYELTSA